jgi:hypothetical protein
VSAAPLRRGRCNNVTTAGDNEAEECSGAA